MAKYIGNGRIQIEPGDTLWTIYGPNWQQLSGYTGDPRTLQVGTQLPAPSHMVPKSEKPASQPGQAATLSAQKAQQDLIKLAADIVDEWEFRQEKALRDLGSGITEETKARLQQQAMDLIKPYFDVELSNVTKQIGEQRLRTQEDYDQAVREIATSVTTELKKIDLTEAQSEEEFAQRMADIGATTEFNLDQARTAWADRMEGEIQGRVEAGLGFAGSTTERMGELERRRGSEMGELVRRGGVQQQAAETEAKYTKERAAAAREAVAAYQTNRTAEADIMRGRGERAFGTGDLSVPSASTNLSFANIPQYGLGLEGERYMQELIRNRDFAREAQFTDLIGQEEENFALAREQALKSAGVADSMFQTYFDTEFKRRAGI